MKPATFILHLRPEPACPEDEGYRRLKAALKCLLRSFRLRCVRVETAQGTVDIDKEGTAEA